MIKLFNIIFLIIYTSINSFSQDTVIDYSNEYVNYLDYRIIKKTENKNFINRDQFGFYYLFELKNNFGSCKYSVFNESGLMLIQGYFKKDTKLNYYEVSMIDSITGDTYKKKYYKYIPKRNRIWRYYDNLGRKIKCEKYRNGNLIWVRVKK